jgi:hypothetical protein
MIKYPMSNRDAMRTVMNRVPAAQVTFVDPVVQDFFNDERLGLCTVEVKRLPPAVVVGDVQHHVIVHYHDPELEMVKRLSI